TLIPQVRLRAPDGTATRLDDLLGPRFALVARDDPRASLSTGALAFLERLGTRFLALGPALRDADGRLDAWLARRGAAPVRPDRCVFGVATTHAEREPLVAALRGGLGAL